MPTAERGKLDPTKVNWNAAQGLTFRQQPGPENPLGFVKMNFPNGHSVYMHDTPKPSLFGRSFRAASSGCVRISGIDELAAWVVADQGWTLENVRKMKETRERLDVQLKQPVHALFRLRHGVGDAGRRSPLPPRHLQQGRHRQGRRRVLRSAPSPRRPRANREHLGRREGPEGDGEGLG